MLSFLFTGNLRRERPEGDDERTQEARGQMVEAQILRRGITDARVLAAMRRVPRHLFVPDYLRDQAHDDGALPIGEGQTISQPYIVAIMTSLLGLKRGERVLEIGTGSGYQTAVLAEVAGEVYTVEIVGRLFEQARDLLGRLGYGNITFRTGDGYRGWEKYAPYDGIIVTAAPTHVPSALLDQLKVGGRLVLPVGDEDQELLKVVKEEKGLRKEWVIPVRFVPMTGEAQRRER
ncbi:MAG: protein-L-isoaspartate O-methyltransferase [Candidatus Handelsmanbacteria bacterium RIFCSPLOWO2_12_FULL_64_10]|uniref:Protein-L-isoaspartate O-methyltransferase n=1 Tax=Handelsmanbacteria sp. (strain RIFCSPLOWO2_12_FULL_64_10) TaxID=1817868 RepID=A0A1F6D465_HANXR|nr:MAG: protein-L-isoaspartate O-methyltransferase [Candidatus Handelsmanbacteria bacterium RIFCSPLOWO2_12_FULL_64_10]